MKWEERWTYDLKTFKPKAVKVRDLYVAYFTKKTAGYRSDGSTAVIGVDIWNTEDEAREAGIDAAKKALSTAEQSAAMDRNFAARVAAGADESDKEAARIKKLLMRMGVAL